ncbi:MAG: 16S rRNA processing protein RimM [Proteobacteria bacterium]|nr:16S rRNA processing protein RimM [Pseudomonadota bacterium]
MPKGSTQHPSQNLVHIATIVGSHGVHGRVKVKAHTELDQDITSYGDVYDKDGNVLAIEITGMATSGHLLISIEGFTRKEHADAALGKELFVAREALPKLQDTQYYYHDLIGMVVRNGKGKDVGVIKDIHNYGASDIIEVHYTGSGKDEMYIFNKANVPEINVKERYLTVIPPEVITAYPDEESKRKRREAKYKSRDKAYSEEE